jgi:hypothetical protein
MSMLNIAFCEHHATKLTPEVGYAVAPMEELPIYEFSVAASKKRLQDPTEGDGPELPERNGRGRGKRRKTAPVETASAPSCSAAMPEAMEVVDATQSDWTRNRRKNRLTHSKKFNSTTNPVAPNVGEVAAAAAAAGEDVGSEPYLVCDWPPGGIIRQDFRSYR